MTKKEEEREAAVYRIYLLASFDYDSSRMLRVLHTDYSEIPSPPPDRDTYHLPSFHKNHQTHSFPSLHSGKTKADKNRYEHVVSAQTNRLSSPPRSWPVVWPMSSQLHGPLVLVRRESLVDFRYRRQIGQRLLFVALFHTRRRSVPLPHNYNTRLRISRVHLD